MDFTAHDWLYIISLVSVGAVVVGTVKTDMRWIKKWCEDHKAQDEGDFNDLRSQLAELRSRTWRE